MPVTRLASNTAGWNTSLLIPSSKRPLPPAILTERLKKMLHELQQMSQGDSLELNFNEFPILLKSSTNTTAILLKIFCEIYRILAPSSPFSHNEDQEIIMKILDFIHNNSSERGLFESLVGLQLIVLVVPATENVLLNLIDKLSILAGFPGYETGVVSVVTQLLEEIPQLSSSAFKKLIQSPILLGEVSSDILQKFVVQYYEHTVVPRINDWKNIDGVDDEILNILAESNCKSLLLLLPELGTELTVTSVKRREGAVRILGKIFKSREIHPTSVSLDVWKDWTQRYNDKIASIRKCWLDAVPFIIESHPETDIELKNMIEARLNDPDDKVRESCLQAIKTISFEHTRKIWKKPFFELVSQRMKDIKLAIRELACDLCCRFYNESCSLFHESNELKDTFGWIPAALIDLLYVNDNSLCALVDKFFWNNLLPGSDFSQIAAKLVEMMEDFDERANNAFLALLQWKGAYRKQLKSYLLTVEKPNSREFAENINSICEGLKRLLLDEEECDVEKFKQLAELKDERLWFNMKRSLDFTQPLSEVQKAMNDVNNRTSLISTELSRSMKRIMNQAGLDKIHTHLITSILKIMPFNSIEASFKLLKSFALVYPLLFTDESISILSDLLLESQMLELLANIVKKRGEFNDVYYKWLPRLLEMIEEDRSAMDAQNIGIILAKLLPHYCSSKDYNAILLEKLIQDLRCTDELLCNKLNILAQIAKYHPTLYRREEQKIRTFLLEDVLASQDSIGDISETCKKKISAIQVLVNDAYNLLRLSPDDPFGQRIYEMLISWLSPDLYNHTPSVLMICEAAAIGFLKLCTIPTFEQRNSQGMKNMVLLGQAFRKQGFHGLYDALLKHLKLEELDVKYFIFLLLAPICTGGSTNQAVSSFLRSSFKRNPDPPINLDLTLVRFLHLLAHLIDDPMHLLAEAERCLKFFFDNILTVENVNFYVYLLNRLRKYRDGHIPDKTEYIFALREFALLLIQRLHSDWPLIPATLKGDIPLPAELFEKASMDDKAYLKAEWLGDLLQLPMESPSLKRPIKRTNKESTIRSTGSKRGEKKRQKYNKETENNPTRRNAPRATKSTVRSFKESSSSSSSESD